MEDFDVMKVKVKFLYDEAVGALHRGRYKKQFINGYNRAAEIVNDNLADWNDEYGETNPNEDGIDPKYEAFLAKRFARAIKAAGIRTRDLVMTADAKRGYCEVVARIKGTANKIRMRWTTDD